MACVHGVGPFVGGCTSAGARGPASEGHATQHCAIATPCATAVAAAAATTTAAAALQPAWSREPYAVQRRGRYQGPPPSATTTTTTTTTTTKTTTTTTAMTTAAATAAVSHGGLQCGEAGGGTGSAFTPAPTAPAAWSQLQQQQHRQQQHDDVIEYTPITNRDHQPRPARQRSTPAARPRARARAALMYHGCTAACRPPCAHGCFAEYRQAT